MRLTYEYILEEDQMRVTHYMFIYVYVDGVFILSILAFNTYIYSHLKGHLNIIKGEVIKQNLIKFIFVFHVNVE